MDEKLKISVVVATYNRAETLVETISHLRNQTLSPREYEVIIVDDESPDHTREVVERAIRDAEFRLRYLHHENHGCGYTQNRGIEVADAPNVLLIADDIFLVPNALESHLRMHARHPEPHAAVLGKVVQSPRANETVFLRKWDPFRFDRLSGRAELPYYMFWACNVSFKREFMLQHGMFREHKGRAGYAAHEDVELGYRLSLHGLRLYYCEDALGHHYHVATLDSELKRAYARGLNWGEFRQFVPEPEVDVKYHVLNRGTLRNHVEALTKGREKLMLPERNPVLLAFLYLARFTIFNRVTVPRFWIPLLKSAEKIDVLGRLMHRNFYRGTIAYHFFRGCHDGVKKYGF